MHHGEDTDGGISWSLGFSGGGFGWGDDDERSGCGQRGEGCGLFDHVGATQGDLARQRPVGREIDVSFDGESYGVASVDQKLGGVVRDRQRRGCDVTRCVSAADGDDGALGNHAVVRFPGGDIVEGDLRAALGA